MTRSTAAAAASLAAPAALAAFLAFAVPTPARADEPTPVKLAVGEKRSLGGYGARCDDLAVVSVTIGAEAVVTGLKPGTTLCSVAVNSAGGARRVLRVTVLAPAPPPPKAQPTAAPPADVR